VAESSSPSPGPAPSSPKELWWLLLILAAVAGAILFLAGDVWSRWFPSE
jgi:MYXO-CTERM domain-containing protein